VQHWFVIALTIQERDYYTVAPPEKQLFSAVWAD
jgi:hypothetical protein